MVGETGFEPATPWSRRGPDGLHALIQSGLASHPMDIAGDATGQGFHAAAPNASLSSRLGAPVVRRFGGAPGELLSVAEVARVLGFSRATVYKLVARGKLGHHRISNSVRIPRDELEAVLARSGLLRVGRRHEVAARCARAPAAGRLWDEVASANLFLGLEQLAHALAIQTNPAVTEPWPPRGMPFGAAHCSSPALSSSADSRWD
jgi:excisionase family DNA binding protein